MIDNLDGYVFTWTQSLVATVVIITGLFLAGFVLWYWDSYGAVLPFAFIIVLAIFACHPILFPAGSENALRLDAEISLRNERQTQYLVIHKEAQREQERLIRERMEKLRSRD